MLNTSLVWDILVLYCQYTPRVRQRTLRVWREGLNEMQKKSEVGPGGPARGRRDQDKMKSIGSHDRLIDDESMNQARVVVLSPRPTREQVGKKFTSGVDDERNYGRPAQAPDEVTVQASSA